MRNILLIVLFLYACSINAQVDSTKLTTGQDSLILVTEEDSLKKVLTQPDSTKTTKTIINSSEQTPNSKESTIITPAQTINNSSVTPKDSLKRKQPQFRNYKKYAAIRM